MDIKISEEIKTLCPGAELGVLLYSARVAASSPELLARFDSDSSELGGRYTLDAIAKMQHIASTREAYRALGKSPHEYRNAAEAMWGTLAVGLFSNGGDGVGKGLLYGGGFTQLGIEALGVVTVFIYVIAIMFVVFKIIDKTIGLRVPAEVEIDGLDIHEHGLASAYSGFAISDITETAMEVNENTNLGEDDAGKASPAQLDAAVKVVAHEPVSSSGSGCDIHNVRIIAKLSKFDELKKALNDLGVTGMTVTQVMGCGIQNGTPERYRGVQMDSTLLPKVQVEVVVASIPVDKVIDSAKKALYTGHIGDGKIFVYGVDRVVKVRTGEEDFAAMHLGSADTAFPDLYLHLICGVDHRLRHIIPEIRF